MMGAIYLDYAAATPVRPEVVRAMRGWWSRQFGNPSSITSAGVDARVAVEQSRRTIADQLSAQIDEIIFTSGGTESVNLALRGILESSPQSHLVTSTIEHHAVLETAAALKARGHAVTIVPVDANGIVDHEKVIAAIRSKTRLISLMLANNEIGTIQPVIELARRLRRVNKERTTEKLAPIYLHTDACAAAGYLDLVSVIRAGVDALSLNAGKIGGPKGVGALYLRRGTPLIPQLTGGGQEGGRRAGTENVPGIVGFACAFELAQKERTREVTRLIRLRDQLYVAIKQAIPDVILNGHETKRLPNNLNLTIPGVEAEPLVLYLDHDGVMVGTGAACSNITLEPSHVLRAIGRSARDALCTIRITLGHTTTSGEIRRAAKLIIYRIQWLRSYAH